MIAIWPFYKKMDHRFNLRTCLAFFSFLEDNNFERILAQCSPGAIIEFEPLGESFKGTVSGIGRIVWSALIESFPDLRIELKDMDWDKEGRKTRCLVSLQGTQLYPFVDIKNTGHSLNITQYFNLYFDDNAKIDLIRVQWNHEEFINQLVDRAD